MAGIQEIFIWMCLIAFAVFSYQESFLGNSMYKLYDNAIFGCQDFDLSILDELLAMNQNSVKELCNLPEHIVLFLVVSIGYPAEKITSENWFDKNKVHCNKR